LGVLLVLLWRFAEWLSVSGFEITISFHSSVNLS